MKADDGMAVKKAEAPGLAPEWRRWLLENLLRGTAPEDLVAELERAGVPSDVARASVSVEWADPYLQGARKATAMQRKLEALLELYGDLFRQAEGASRVERHEALAPEDFFERYYFQNLPVVLGRGAWAEAMDGEAWAPARLEALLGGQGGAPRSTLEVPLFGDERLRPLWDTLRSPRGYAAEDVRACEPRLWWWPPGVEEPPRAARRNLLLGQLHGRGTARLVPAFELVRMSGGVGATGEPLRLEVTLAPGELLLVPVGWWYGVHAPEGGVAVSFEAFATAEPNVTWDAAPAEPEPTPLPTSLAKPRAG